MPKSTASKHKKELLIEGTWQFNLPEGSAQSIVLAAMLFHSICPSKLIDVHSNGSTWHLHVRYRIPADSSLARHSQSIQFELEKIFTHVRHDLHIDKSTSN